MAGFKCEKCEKIFDSQTALTQHSQAKHNENQPQVVRAPIKIPLKWILIAAVVAVVIGMVAFFTANRGQQFDNLGSPVSQTVYGNITSVSDKTLNAVGIGAATKLQKISGSPLNANGKPEILYIGSEYCPYCASERWALVLALSKFGNFTGLTYMASSPTDVYANTPTFSFLHSAYSSNYLTFQSVEMQDRYGNSIQSLSPDQNAILVAYDTGGSIPFTDIGNQYTLVGAQFLPTALSGMNWDQIAQAMNDPTSSAAQNIDGAANIIISAICSTTNSQPFAVCSQPYAQLKAG